MASSGWPTSYSNTDLDSLQRDYAETVRTSGEALLTVINDILDFSKIEAGKMEIEDLEFNLQTVIDNVLDLLGTPAENKGLGLAAVIDDSVPATVSGDPVRVRQVLINLIGNAIKFTRIGHISSGPSKSSPLRRMPFFASRSPIPATESLRTNSIQIFHPFVQADMSTSRKYGGTGLGLSISGQLVGLMGGDCGVESQAGQAAPFGLRFESASPQADAETFLFRTWSMVFAARCRDRQVQCSDRRRRLCRRQRASDHLSDFGLSVSTADSGEAALAMLRAAAFEGRPFAVCLLAQSMPGMVWIDLKNAIASIRPSPLAWSFLTESGAAQEGGDQPHVRSLRPSVPVGSAGGALGLPAGRLGAGRADTLWHGGGTINFNW